MLSLLVSRKTRLDGKGVRDAVEVGTESLSALAVVGDANFQESPLMIPEDGGFLRLGKKLR